MRTLFDFLSKNKNKAEGMIKMLHQLGIDIEQEIDKLEGEVVRGQLKKKDAQVCIYIE